MNLDVVWEYLKEKREREEIEKLDQMVVVPDSFKSMEYVLTHRFVNSSSAFIGKDQNGNKLHVKVCSVPSFDDVKSIHKNLKLVSDCQIDLQLVPVIEIIEFFEGSRWVVLLISPYLEGFTLEELSEALHLHGFYLDKNTGISVFLSILDIIKVADSKAAFIISTMPDNVFFISNTIESHGIISTETASYALKILATSRQWLFCGRSRIEKLYPSSQKRNHVDGMIWGAGLCLYGLVSSQALSTLPALNEINDTERGELLKFHFEDEALSYIIKHSLKNTKPPSFTSHPYIKL